MPRFVGSPKLGALGLSPFLMVSLFDTILNQLEFFSSLSPAQVGDSSPSPINLITPTSTYRLGMPALHGPAASPMPLLFPTPTIPAGVDNDIRLLLLTWLIGLILFLSLLTILPCLYVLSSHSSLRTRLRGIIPSAREILLAVVICIVLLRWPGVQEYPIEEIYNAVLRVWRGLSSEHQPEVDIVPKFSVKDPRYDLVATKISRKEPKGPKVAYQKVAIVLEKREDGTLWVVEFNYQVPLADASVVPDTHHETQRLSTGDEEHVTVDLAAIKAKFTSAPDLLPSAPWRVLGLHTDPIETSFFSDQKEKMYRLDQNYSAKHFSYSLSQDPNASEDSEEPFWDASPTAQGEAWTLIHTQSRRSYETLSLRPDRFGIFYHKFSFGPYLPKLKQAIALSEKKAAGLTPYSFEEDEDDRRFNRSCQKFMEDWNRQLQVAKDLVRREEEYWERNDALWRREIKRLDDRIASIYWRARSGLRSRRKLS